MNAGRITHIRANEIVLALKENYPSDLEPLRVVEDFLKVVDFPKTKLLQKTSKPSVSTRSSKKPIMHQESDIIGRHFTVSIYKHIVIKMYRTLPEVFIGSDLISMFKDYYKEYDKKLSSITLNNRSRAYILFLERNGFIANVSITTGRQKAYSFVQAPFGIEPPVKAEHDPEFLRKQKELELETMRKA